MLFGTGFALAWVGYWVELSWVQWLAFGIGVIGQVHLMIACGFAAQRWWAGYFAWYHEAYQRNVRAAERQAAGEAAAPRLPNDEADKGSSWDGAHD